jgi:flagellar basal body-associated protein FliL
VATEEDKVKVTSAVPRLRDGIIAYLADRSFDELRGSDGLERAKGHLLERVKAAVPGAAVKNLYISDIVVQ